MDPRSLCGMTFGARVKTMTLDTAWTPARRVARMGKGGKGWIDSEALKEQFGDGREVAERVQEETQGIGIMRTGPDGRVYHRDRHSKEVEVVDPKVFERMFGE